MKTAVHIWHWGGKYSLLTTPLLNGRKHTKKKVKLNHRQSQCDALLLHNTDTEAMSRAVRYNRHTQKFHRMSFQLYLIPLFSATALQPSCKTLKLKTFLKSPKSCHILPYNNLQLLSLSGFKCTSSAAFFQSALMACTTNHQINASSGARPSAEARAATGNKMDQKP